MNGRINTRHYENGKGDRVYVTEVVADFVQFLDPKPQDQGTQQQQGQGSYPKQSNPYAGNSSTQNQNGNQFEMVGGPIAVSDDDRRNEGEMAGYDEYFAPTCVLEHFYCYDSFDTRYKTLKYTCPKECATCPLQNDSLCKKTYKIRQSTDIRKYTNPARGSGKWDELYKERTAVERVNAYLKEFFGLNNVRDITG